MASKSKSEVYWDQHERYFPFQIKVPHMSREDIDPKAIPRLIGWRHKFLRVPFNGEAHWGFQSQAALEAFRTAVELTKVSS